jgi:hypothetical protein
MLAGSKKGMSNCAKELNMTSKQKGTETIASVLDYRSPYLLRCEHVDNLGA